MQHEVVIVGAGPAGAVAAARLAMLGHDVLVLERERFPRFHIGESLLPMCMPVLSALGVELEGAHLRKLGASFVDESSNERQAFAFAEALGNTPDHAYNVERASFDALLAERAAAAGAKLAFAERVVRIELPNDEPGSIGEPAARSGVDVYSETRRYRARYLLDASGQHALLARKHRSRVPVRAFGRAASYVHYENLARDAWDELASAGNVLTLRHDDGWTWAIPLLERRLSVGTVARRSPVERDLVRRTVAASPLLRRLTAGAHCGEPRLVGDYSWGCERTSGSRWLCVGDAAGFIDPVFSTGITLAVVAASLAADRLHQALVAGTEADPELMAPVRDHMGIAYDTFGLIVRRFYRTNWVRNVFLAPTLDAKLRRGLLTILAGDVWYRDNPFTDLLFGSRRLHVTPWYFGDSR